MWYLVYVHPPTHFYDYNTHNYTFLSFISDSTLMTYHFTIC